MYVRRSRIDGEVGVWIRVYRSGNRSTVWGVLAGVTKCAARID